MNRRFSRRAGFRGIGGSTSFTPLSLGASLYAWWDADSLASGAVASWLDRTGVHTLANGTSAQQPTKSATAFTAPDATTYPGVSFDGGDLLSVATLGAVLDPLSAFCITLSMQDTVTGSGIVLEYGPTAFAGAGRWALVVNDSGAPAHSLEFHSRNTGNGTWQSAVNTAPLADPGVVTGRYDLAQASGQTLRRLDGVDLAGSAFASACAAGTWASETLYVGARTGIVAPWTGKIRDLVIYSGAATSAQITQVERFVGGRVGAVVA